MEKDTLYPAEFAQLYGISKDTLLYYDKIGLFRPQVRAENGYRLYSLDQIHSFDLILMLRAVHVPLEKIKQCLKAYEPEQVNFLLEEQAVLLTQQITELENLRRRMLATAKKIQYAMNAEYDIPHMAYLPEAHFAAFETTPDMLVDRLKRISYVRQQLQYCQLHGLPYDFLRSGVIKKEHLEAGQFDKDYYCVRTETPPDDIIHITRPAGLYALIEHKGSYDTLNDAYHRLKGYIAAQNSRIAGNAYELEILGYAAVRSPEDYVVQIAIQIEEPLDP